MYQKMGKSFFINELKYQQTSLHKKKKKKQNETSA